MSSEPSAPAAFLQAFGRLIEARADSGTAQDVRDAAMEEVLGSLESLLRQNAFPTFLFRNGEVEYEGERLEELRSWEWSLRLPEGGIDRMDVTPGTTREDLEGFVGEVVARLFLEDDGASLRELDGQVGIQFSDVEAEPQENGRTDSLAPLEFGLEAEAEAVAWLNAEIANHGVVPVAEASTVVQLLSIAMHSERDVVVPLVQLKTVDQYTTTHSINVACLSMALAEHLMYASTDVRAIGEAALLHDVGKSRIPVEVLNKKGRLTEDEWTLIQSHTVEGARILLASGRGMELAATVAYEHHLSLTGEGYPALTYSRPTHEASRLVQVCDVYDALRTRRPFRPPWPADRALEFLHEKAGTHLDPDYVSAFVRMIGVWEPRRVELESGEETAASAA